MAGGELSGKQFELGRPCPKCGYVRVITDTNPVWQCPKCQIAYAKFIATTPLAVRLAGTGQRLAGEAAVDRSVYALIAANLVALLIARMTGMSLRELMLVYWIQSVIIGISYFIRMLSLQHFSTENLKVNDEPVEETPESKWRIACFFLLHYGFFHFVYLMFIALDRDAPPVSGSTAGYALCALVFAVNHGYSLLRNIRLDARGKPNLGTMMMLPYARIVPMHMTILFGGMLSAGGHAIFIFAGLKIVADAVMHSMEHYILGNGQLLPPPG